MLELHSILFCVVLWCVPLCLKPAQSNTFLWLSPAIITATIFTLSFSFLCSFYCVEIRCLGAVAMNLSDKQNLGVEVCGTPAQSYLADWLFVWHSLLVFCFSISFFSVLILYSLLHCVYSACCDTYGATITI